MTLSLTKSNAKGVLVTLLLMVVFIFVVDFAMKLWNPIPNSASWGVGDLDEKMALLDAHYKKYGRIDVLAVGSSVVKCLDTGLMQRTTNDKLVFFNLGSGGIWAENVEFYLENYVLPKYKPKHVVYIVQPRFILKEPGSVFPFNKHFWDSRMVRELSPQPLYMKVALKMEDLLYITQRKQLFRTLISKPEQLNNVAVAPGRINEYGLVNERNWKIAGPNGFRKTNIDQMDMTENIAAIGRIAAMCKKAGMSFDVAEQGFNPLLWEKFPAQLKKDYEKALELMAGKNSCFFMVSSVPLTDEDYFDHVHMNGWGMEKADLFIFNKIISRKYYKEKYTLNPSLRLPFASRDNTVTGEFSVGKYNNATEQKYQLFVESPGGSVRFGQKLPAGTYELSVWACNNSTSVPAEVHKMELILTDDHNKEIHRTPLAIETGWAPYLPVTARVRVPDNTTATVTLKVNSIALQKRLIFDTLSVRVIGDNPLRGSLVSADMATTRTAGVPVGTSVIMNGNFRMDDAITSIAIAYKWSYHGKTALKTNEGILFKAQNNDWVPVTQWNATVDGNPELVGKKLLLNVRALNSGKAIFSPSVYFDEVTSTGIRKRVKYPAKLQPGSNDGQQIYAVEFTMPQRLVKGFITDLHLNSATPAGETLTVEDVRLTLLD